MLVMKRKYDYVSAVLSEHIIICYSKKESKYKLKSMGGVFSIFQRGRCKIKFSCENKNELAEKLELLRDSGFYFAYSPAGWPPSAIFELLRDEGYISGSFYIITWKNRDDVLVQER